MNIFCNRWRIYDLALGLICFFSRSLCDWIALSLYVSAPAELPLDQDIWRLLGDLNGVLKTQENRERRLQHACPGVATNSHLSEFRLLVLPTFQAERRSRQPEQD